MNIRWLVATLLAGALACAPREPGAAAPVPDPAPAPGSAVLVGAGDIARCGAQGDESTARLVDSVVRGAERSRMPVAVFTAGDNAYPNGTLEELRDCFGASWGRSAEVRRLLRPALGDHEYGVPGAADYFAYFGPAAGPPGQGWYTYRLGEWRIIALNSAASASAPGGPQVRWLRAVLAADRGRCTLAYWHAPRFSTGVHGGYPDVGVFWSQLYSAGADVVVSGDDHDYERFAPQSPEGTPDSARGLREFVVGTGGATLRGFDDVRAEPAFLYHRRPLPPTSQRRIAGKYGVLRLVLEPGGYRWEFIDTQGRVEDAGSDACHPGRRYG